jgi:hypothetical protein
MIVDDLFSSNLPFDWDQFLVADADRAAVEAVTALDKEDPATSQVNTPASEADTPNSTESEQSNTLEVGDFFNFDMDSLPTGITHDPSDLLSSLATPVVPDVSLAADPTMLSTFGSSFGADLGSFAALSNDPVTQFQLGNILSQLTASTPSVVATPVAAIPSLPEAYAALGWPLTSKTPSSMASPALSSLAMKRKASDSSDDGSSVKRPRGRPPSTTPSAKRPYRRQSKNGLSLSQLAAAAASGKPVIVDEKPPLPVDDEEDEVEAATPMRLTSTGKPSTARPKAVVPEKYMKNGEAQAITGMNTEQILSFPNWSALMECVDEPHRAGAEVFGKMITENRDKAKWAAKKSRDERKAKVECLEGQVDELNGKIAEMRGLLLGLVGRGLVPLSDVEAFI